MEVTKINTSEKKKGVTAGETTATNVSIHNMISNTILSLVKLAAGILAHSQAIISDAIHSAADVFETVIVIIGVKMSGKVEDDEHQYGHERFECVAASILAAILFITGALIGAGGIRKILKSSYDNVSIPGMLAVVIAILSILVKESMYWYTRINAKRIGSSALMADAWHHRLDALCSAGSLVGVIGARAGYPICDPLASVLICIFILKAAIEIYKDALGKMVDRACDKETEEKIREIISKQPGVLSIGILRTRLFGMKIYVDVEVKVEGSQPLIEADKIGKNVQNVIEEEIRRVKHCLVYLSPISK